MNYTHVLITSNRKVYPFNKTFKVETEILINKSFEILLKTDYLSKDQIDGFKNLADTNTDVWIEGEGVDGIYSVKRRIINGKEAIEFTDVIPF